MLIRNWGLIKNQVELLLTVDSFYRMVQTESSHHQCMGWKFFFLTLFISKTFPLQLNPLKMPVLLKPHPTTQGDICCVGCDADLRTIIRWDHLRTIFLYSAWTFYSAHVTFDGQWSDSQTLQPESATSMGTIIEKMFVCHSGRTPSSTHPPSANR